MKKKNLWLVALVSALTIAFVSGCPEEEKKTTAAEKPAGAPTGNSKNTKVHEWKKVQKSADFVNSDIINSVEMSRDGKYVYFAHDGNAVRVFEADAANFETAIADKTKFSPVALQTSAGDDTTPGGAKVTGATVSSISPTETGALLHVAKAAPGSETGVVYVNGKLQTAIGWVNDAGGVVHFNQRTAAAADAISAYSVVGANGAELVYICGVSGGGAGACSTELRAAVNLKTPVAAKLGKDLTMTGNWAAAPILVSTGADAWVVSTVGVQKMLEAELGTGKNFGQLNANAPKYGADLWKTESAAGAANTPRTAVFANGKVYIGFASTGANDGGVNVFDVADDKIAGFTDAAWKGVSVIGFAVHGNDVYAVSKKGIFAVKADGKKGDQLSTKAEAADFAAANDGDVYDKGEAMPTDKISGAKFVGDNLIITTTDKGIFYRLAAKARVYNK